MEEILIEKVRQRELLYNMESPNYRDQHLRQEAWEDIAKDMNMRADYVKNNWDKLRRCFLNAISRRQYNERNGKNINHWWKYERQMAFLLPFVHCRKLQNNLQDMDAEELMNYDEEVDEISGSSQLAESIKQESILPDSAPEVSFDIEANKKRKLDHPIQQSAEVTKYLFSSRELESDDERTKDMDETEMFFMSMAKMTKTLPPLEQAEIKLQLSNSVLQAQIRMNSRQYQERSHCTCSFSRYFSTKDV